MAGRYARVLSLAASVLNRLAELDPELAAGVADLEGARVLLRFTSPAIEVQVRVSDGRFQLEEGVSHEPDVVISGTANEFLTFVRARRAGQPTPSGLVRISGDLAVAERMQRLLAGAGVDWEGLLAGVIGDVPTHWVSGLVRQSGRFADARLRSLAVDLREYLLYEAELVPTREAFVAHVKELRDLRAALDRAEARLDLLTSGRTGGSQHD